MFNRAATTGISRQQIITVALIFIVLFVVSFRLSGLIFNANAPVADSSASAGAAGIASVNPPHRLQDFTLTSKSGDPIRLSDLRGRAVVLFFGYTHCPDVCPTTLADYRRVKALLGDQARDTSFVFVSVDGERDTPEQMTGYLDQFDPEFVGMTGDVESLRRIGAEYGLAFSEERVTIAGDHADHHVEGDAEGDELLDQQNYFVQHTSPSFLIDRDGVLRMVAFYGTKPETIAASVRQLLQENAQ